MSERKCRNCGAGVSRFDLLCRPCNVENSAALEADARIRGAAHELLAACEWVYCWLESVEGEPDPGQGSPMFEALRAAIAKARGPDAIASGAARGAAERGK